MHASIFMLDLLTDTITSNLLRIFIFFFFRQNGQEFPVLAQSVLAEVNFDTFELSLFRRWLGIVFILFYF